MTNPESTAVDDQRSHPPYCPLIPPFVRAARLASGRFVLNSLGLEKQCPHCEDYWPADTEFFFCSRSNADQLSNWCKACYLALTNRLSKRNDLRKAG